MPSPAPVVRDASPDDVPAICRFGDAVVPLHYTPLIGAAAAGQQVRTWWNEELIRAAVSEGRAVVAEAEGEMIGVGQRGWRGTDHVIFKLYVDPRYRGDGLGPRLIEALARQLPADAEKLYVEHIAANERSGAFFDREGFAVREVEPSPTGDPSLAAVWRSRPLGAPERSSDSP